MKTSLVVRLLALSCLLYTGTASATLWRMIFVEHKHDPISLRYECIDNGCPGGPTDVWVPDTEGQAMLLIEGDLSTGVASPEALTVTILAATFPYGLAEEGKYNFRKSATDSTVGHTLEVSVVELTDFSQTILVTFVSGKGAGLDPLPGGTELIEGVVPDFFPGTPFPGNFLPDSANMVGLVSTFGPLFVAFRVVPEPASLALIGIGLAGLLLIGDGRRTT